MSYPYPSQGAANPPPPVYSPPAALNPGATQASSVSLTYPNTQPAANGQTPGSVFYPNPAIQQPGPQMPTYGYYGSTNATGG
jgi:hypothetical protein